MKRIKIFLASSITEFEEERLELKDFVRRQEDVLIDNNIRIRLFMCEYADNTIAIGRKQGEYNAEIEDSDIFFMLVGKKLGEYTLEEYRYAQNVLKSKGKPLVYIAFKQCGETNEEVKMFLKEVSLLEKNSKEVCVGNFNMISELKEFIFDAINKELNK